MSIFDYVAKMFAKPVSYLDEQRGLIGERIARGMDPFSYLPTVMGDISGGRMTRTDLNTDEIVWILDELQRQLDDMLRTGYSRAEIDAKKAEQALYLDALKSKGGSWEPTVVVPTVPVVPPNDPSRGR